MKIYKLGQNYQVIPQNPGAQNDPNIQLQNMQNAQGAIQYFQSVIEASNQIKRDVDELEELLDVGDLGLKNQLEDVIKAAAMRTEAFNLLAHMNLVASIENLLDERELNVVENLIITNISSISDQMNTFEF